MNRKRVFSLCTTTLILLHIHFLTAGNLVTSRQKSYLTYIYNITDKEAEKIHKCGLYRVDSSYLHTLVDTYPTDSVFQKKLPTGHYLETHTQKNIQIYKYLFIPRFEVKILNNNTDLCIQILQPDGKIIRDASVHLGASRLTYDAATQCFVRRKTSRNGLLKVTANGQTGYYQIKKDLGLTPFLRSLNTLQYRPPFNFIASPIRFLIHLPADAIESIEEHDPTGVIWNARNFFRHPGEVLYYMLHPSGPRRFDGYFVFNKPKYMPGDSVKFKAFIVNSKMKPLNKTVSVAIFKDRYELKDPIYLGKIKPHHPGSYDFKFKITDSLNLKLDDYYKIVLTNGGKKYYISNDFRYEQYELNPLKLTLTSEIDKHCKGLPMQLKIKCSDDNGLNLLDARVEINLITKEIKKTYDKFTFVPDTLCTSTRELNPVGETALTLPDSVFPNADISYTAHVRLLTSDNKTLTQTKQLEYFYKEQNIGFKVLTDSIEISYKENDLAKNKQVSVCGTDFFGNKVPVMNATTPFRFALNTCYNRYIAVSDTVVRTLDMAKENQLLNCITSRTTDSLFIRVNNPRNLHFTYNIYKRNTETNRGSGNSLDIAQRIHTKENYYVSLRYLWAGEIEEETQRIVYYDKKLNVKLIQPELIYPGQKVNMDIEVNDQAGKPVEGVDLTAFSLTSKFGYNQPSLPYLGRMMPSKKIVNNFKIPFINSKLKTAELMLDYPKWKKTAQLDSIEFYKFLYPGNEIYRFEYPAEENITQFAPYVISANGNIEPVHIVYVDNRPVYFDWTDNIEPYSFRTDSLPHKISLRTRDKEITLNNLQFRSGYKTIFSFTENTQNKNIILIKTTYYPSLEEKYIVKNNTLIYENNFANKFAYITCGKNIHLLNPTKSGWPSSQEVGPIDSKSMDLMVLDSYTKKITFDPNYKYEFTPDEIKMQVNKKEFWSFENWRSNEPKDNFGSMALTTNTINKLKNEYIKSLRPHFNCNNPWKFTSDFGQFQLYYEPKFSVDNIPFNLILIRYDSNEHIRVYSGMQGKTNLLEAGRYKMVSLYADSSYSVTDSITIKPRGTTLISIDSFPQRKKDAFSENANGLFDKTVLNGKFTDNDLITLQKYLIEQFKYEGEGRIIQGTIKDSKTGKSIMDAVICVKGTSYGTVSKADGSFIMKIPNSAKSINIIQIGYDTFQTTLSNSISYNISLSRNALPAKEILVGDYRKYEFSEKQRTVACQTIYKEFEGLSVASVDDALQGKISGLDIVGSSGGRAPITNESVSSKEKAKPLYIVDGRVYAGDISKIDKSTIESTEELSAEKATGLYGSMASNGAILITTKSNKLKTQLAKEGKGADYDQVFLEAVSKASSMRKNYSDYAFWQPRLITDKQGKASFEVTFPDDVTRWQTHVLAMNGKRQSGQTSADVKSYKPLMVQLAVPNFMLEHDSATVMGKALNYLPDSVHIRTSFSVNNGALIEKSHVCTNASLDSLPVVATADSLSLRYTLTKSGGYTDGEERKVPVYPIGLEETKGNFLILDKDTTFNVTVDPASDCVLHTDADYLDLMDKEIGHIMRYAYYCNEQIASKLYALLADRTITAFKGKKFHHDDEIYKMIRLLIKNRKENGGWGWWKDSETHYEFSAYILQALAEAKKQGFKVEIDPTEVARKFVCFLGVSADMNLSSNVALLKALKTFDAVVNYPEYIDRLDKATKKTLNQSLKLMELKQLCGLTNNTDLLKTYRQKTMIGNIFYRDEHLDKPYIHNDIENTLIAYRIIRQEKKESPEVLASMRRYFMEVKQNYCNWNTYESAQILETILPDILKEKQKSIKSKLNISGDITQTIAEFPCELKLKAGQKITVCKSGNDPVYFSTYQRYFNPTPKAKKGDFVISTQFGDQSDSQLKAGKAVKLVVKLKVLRDADYVMLGIPIPAGCSYGEKTQPRQNEVHREYFKNETAIFCQKLAKGEYTFEINLLPRFTGRYTLNPAKAELMYFPVFNGNNELKEVDIR